MEQSKRPVNRLAHVFNSTTADKYPTFASNIITIETLILSISQWIRDFGAPNNLNFSMLKWRHTILGILRYAC
jgi:hypothetical protein